MPRLIVCRNCTESDCTYCNINILAVALERGYFNSLMREQHTVQIDSELVPVRHGRWIEGNNFHWYSNSCSCCGYTRTTDIKSNGWNQWKYCPMCGAKMDEVEDEE